MATDPTRVTPAPRWGHRAWMAWVALAALAARIGFFTVSGAPAPKHLEYSVIAEHLNAGQGFVFEQYGAPYRAWKEPLYILWLAGVGRMPGAHDAIALAVQWLLGVAVALGIARLAERLYRDSRRGLIAGLLAAVNPFLVYYDTRLLHPLSLDTALFVAVVAAHLSAIDRCFEGMIGRTAQAGLVTGLALWERATLASSGLAMWLVALIAGPKNRRPVILPAIVMWIGIAGLVIAPWFWRNYQLFGRVIYTTDSAHVFWLGNNPWSNGTYSDARGERVIALADPAFAQRIAGASELVQYDRFRDAARAFVREHPLRFAQLCLTRLLAFVWFSPNAGIEYTPRQQQLYRGGYALLLVWGIMGWLLWWARSGPEDRLVGGLLLASVGGLALTHSLIAINLKHRVPLELILGIFAAEAIVRLIGGHHKTPTT